MTNYASDKAHYIVVTGIIVRDGKYFIAKRSAEEKAFPNLWTVPGGKLEMQDYTSRPKDTNEHWYNVLEDVLRREIKEETGLEVKDINYVTSLVYIREDGIPTLIVSLSCAYASGEVKLCPVLTDYAWVSLDEAKEYELIEGIYEELEILDQKISGAGPQVWRKQS